MSLAKRNEREYLDIEDSGAGFRITLQRSIEPPARRQWRLMALALAFVMVYGWIYMRAAAQIAPSLSDVDGPSHGDFGHFYHAALAMRQHADPYAAWKQGYLYPPLL